MQEATVTLTDPVGLHARPAAVVVQTAGRYQARVRIAHGAREADARSIIQVLGLGARQGSQVRIVAEGSDEAEVVAAIVALLTAPSPGEPAANHR